MRRERGSWRADASAPYCVERKQSWSTSSRIPSEPACLGRCQLNSGRNRGGSNGRWSNPKQRFLHTCDGRCWRSSGKTKSFMNGPDKDAWLTRADDSGQMAGRPDRYDTCLCEAAAKSQRDARELGACPNEQLGNLSPCARACSRPRLLATRSPHASVIMREHARGQHRPDWHHNYPTTPGMVWSSCRRPSRSSILLLARGGRR